MITVCVGAETTDCLSIVASGHANSVDAAAFDAQELAKKQKEEEQKKKEEEEGSTSAHCHGSLYCPLIPTISCNSSQGCREES